MKKRDLASGRFFVGLAGGEITCLSEDGKERWKVGMLPGIQFADTYGPYMGTGDTLRLSGAVELVKPGGSRVKPIDAGPEHFESGANPEFRPTLASTQQRRVEKMLADVTRRSNALEKRMKSFESMTAKAAQRQEGPVIETETTSEPQEQPAQAPEATAEGSPTGEPKT